MLLSELLRPSLITVGLDARSKTQAIGELVDVLVQDHEIAMKNRSSVLEAVLESEDAQHSGMERGIAVPHGLSDKLEDVICAVGIAPKGVPFDCLDGQPATIIVLVVAPKRSYAAEIRMLTGIQNLLKHDSLRAGILKARTSQEVFDLIEKEEMK